MSNTTIDYLGKRFGVDTTVSPVRLSQINRTILAQVFAELGFKTGAEIGVAEGHYSKVLFENIPDLKLFAVDAWKTYPGYTELQNPEEVFEGAKKLLEAYNCEFVRKFSMEAVNDFEDNSLDFVFIDGGHDFKNVSSDICEWSKKVRPGGIVFGHDYKFHKAFLEKRNGRPPKQRYAVEVKIVVDAYRDARGINPWFEMYSEISDPTFGRDNPCWLFVRQENDRV